MHSNRPGYQTVLWRSLRLRCPRCGQGKLFKGWFTMHPRCESCGLVYEREPGFFLGSIYVNYGLTAMLVTIGYFGLFFADVMTPQQVLWLMLAFSLVFPLLFFRHARSLWLGFDQYWDPRDLETAKPAEETGSTKLQ